MRTASEHEAVTITIKRGRLKGFIGYMGEGGEVAAAVTSFDELLQWVTQTMAEGMGETANLARPVVGVPELIGALREAVQGPQQQPAAPVYQIPPNGPGVVHAGEEPERFPNVVTGPNHAEEAKTLERLLGRFSADANRNASAIVPWLLPLFLLASSVLPHA